MSVNVDCDGCGLSIDADEEVFCGDCAEPVAECDELHTSDVYPSLRKTLGAIKREITEQEFMVIERFLDQAEHGHVFVRP